MERNRKHIDEFLSERLGDQPMLADGIGWDDFNKKRNKKRGIFWFTLLSSVALMIVGFIFTFQQITNIPSKSAEQTKTPSIENDIVVHESDVNSNPPEAQQSGPSATAVKPRKSSLPTNPNGFKPQMSPAPDTLITSFSEFPALRVSTKPFHFNVQFPSFTQQVTVSADSTEIEFVDDFYIKDIQPTSNWLLKVNVGPSVVNPKFVVNSVGQNRVHKSYADIRNNGEVGALGFSFSASIAKDMKRIQPFVGIGVSRMNVFANYNFTYSEFPVLDLDGTILEYQSSTPKQVAFKSNQSITSIDIPFGIDVNLITLNHWTIQLHQSFNSQILIELKGETPNAVFLDNRTQINSGSVKSNIMSYQSGFTFNRYDGVGAYWYVQPYFVKSFGLQNTLGLYKTNLNAFGLNFGWKKKLSL